MTISTSSTSSTNNHRTRRIVIAVLAAIVVVALAFFAFRPGGWLNNAQPAANVNLHVVNPDRTMNWPAFRDPIVNHSTDPINWNDPYAVINWLDSRIEKVDHPSGNWVISGTASLVWTGLYSSMPPTGTHMLLTDGLTGIYVIEGGVTVPTAGGEIKLNGYDGNVPQVQPEFATEAVDVSAPDCATTSQVKAIIDAWKDSVPDQVFTNLDVLVDNLQRARLRAGGPGNVKVEAGKALLWGQPGSIVDPSVKVLLTSNGKALFLATKSATVSVMHAFSGVALCEKFDGTAAPVATKSYNKPAPAATAAPAQPSGASCVAKGDLVSAINNNKGSAAMYDALAKFPGVKHDAGDVTVSWLKSLIVVSDSATGDVISVDQVKDASGTVHALYLGTKDGSAHVSHNFTLLTSCDNIDPAKDFPWWGK